MKALTLPLLGATALTIAVAWGFFNWQTGSRSKSKDLETIFVRPVAEFESTFGVGISEQTLLKKDGMALMKAILTSGTRVYVFVSADHRPTIEKLLHTSPLLHGIDRDSIVKIQLEHESMWARDYFPIPILKQIPHVIPTPSFVDFVYRDGNSLDDAAIYQFALSINLSVEHLPIVLDGGNFMSNGEKCIISEEFSEDPEVLMFHSTEPPLLTTIGQTFKTVLGCQKTIVVSQLPHPHVDMWMKFLTKNVLAINSIDSQEIEHTKGLSDSERAKARQISNELDKTAKVLATDFEIVRLPMPVPTENLLLTYSNAILSNGKAVVPRYSRDLKTFKNEKPGLINDWKKSLPEKEKMVESIYRRLGYDVIFVDSNEWIQDGGSFHCVTFHLPDLDAIVKEKG